MTPFSKKFVTFQDTPRCKVWQVMLGYVGFQFLPSGVTCWAPEGLQLDPVKQTDRISTVNFKTSRHARNRTLNPSKCWNPGMHCKPGDLQSVSSWDLGSEART
jgi:hypothetical protein